MLTVMFQVSAADSGAVMQALAPIMTKVINFNMEAKSDEVKRKIRKVAPRGSRVERLVQEALQDGPSGTGPIAAHLEANGFKASSASPALSHLKRRGVVAWNPTEAQWSLVS